MLDDYLLGIKIALREYPGVRQFFAHQEKKMLQEIPKGVVVVNDMTIHDFTRVVENWRKKVDALPSFKWHMPISEAIKNDLDTALVFDLWRQKFSFAEIADHLGSEPEVIFQCWKQEAKRRGLLT